MVSDGCLAKGSKRKLSHCIMVSDDCQAKGSKRKLNQVTLLQLNFSRSKVNLHSGQSADYPIIPSEPDRIRNCDTIDNLNGLNRSEDCANNNSLPVRNDSFPSHVVSKDTADYKFASPSSPFGIESPKYIPEEPLDDYDVSRVIISTFIVGRRFGCREELHPKSRIYLSRDPENANDPNAIKVHIYLALVLFFFDLIHSSIIEYYFP